MNKIRLKNVALEKILSKLTGHSAKTILLNELKFRLAIHFGHHRIKTKQD